VTEAAWHGAGRSDQVTQAARSETTLTVSPLLHGGGELPPKTLKLADTSLNRSEMIFREREARVSGGRGTELRSVNAAARTREQTW